MSGSKKKIVIAVPEDEAKSDAGHWAMESVKWQTEAERLQSFIEELKHWKRNAFLNTADLRRFEDIVDRMANNGQSMGRSNAPLPSKK